MATVFACDLTAFTPDQRGRLRGLAQRVFEACRQAEELPDGFRLRFAAGDGALALVVAEWITLERRCCPCITFAMEFEAERGPIAVRMTGPEGIKPFLLSAFNGRIADRLAHAR